LYADDLVVTTETEDDLIERLNEWKDNMENRGMRVNMNKKQGYGEILTCESDLTCLVYNMVLCREKHAVEQQFVVGILSAPTHMTSPHPHH